MKDQEVVRQVLEGRAELFEEIVKRYEQAVFRTAYRLLGNQQEAEDAAQEAFLKCYQSLPSYDPQKPFLPWLYRLTTNIALSRLRRQKRRRVLFRKNFSPDPPETDPEAAWAKKETSFEVAAAIKSLKPLDRCVVILRYFEGLSYEEIAYALQTKRNSVEVRLSRARQKLRLILSSPQKQEGREEKCLGAKKPQSS